MFVEEKKTDGITKARAMVAEEDMEDAEEAMEEQRDGDRFIDEDPDSMFVPET